MLRESDIRELKKVSKEAPVTGNTYQDLLGIYKLPPKLEGLRILDVCSGESDFPYWLLKNGAEVYALDIHYQDFGDLHQKHLETLVRMVNEMYDTQISPTDSRVQKMSTQALENFYCSVRNNPSSYIAGSAHNLPFADETFDLITSFYGIFGVIDRNKLALKQTLRESLRVIKPGGELQIAPAMVGPLISKGETKNQRKLLEKLQRNKKIYLSFELRKFQNNEIGLVIIRKKNS